MSTMINDFVLSGVNRVGTIDDGRAYLVLTQFELDAIARICQDTKFDITIQELDTPILKFKGCSFFQNTRPMIPSYEIFAELFNYEHMTDMRGANDCD